MKVCELKIHGDIDAGLIDPILDQIENSDCDAFLLRINTEGGLVDKAFQLISELKNSGKPFFAINEGFAISCGAVILASADKAYSYPYGVSLIHDPFYSEGEPDEFLLKVKDSLMSILSSKIHTDNLSDLLSQETTWNAREALEYGLVDEIIGESVLPVSNYRKDVVISLFDNKKLYNLMNKELEEKIANEMSEEKQETVTETPETPAEIAEEIKEEAAEIAEETKVENECGKPEEEVKNEETKEGEGETKEEVKNDEESRIAELERLITEKDAYIAELEKKLEEATGKQEEVINKETVNKLSAQAIDEIKHLFDSEAVLNDDIRLAEKIFDINGDETLRLRIREKQPELYNRLLEKYYSK